MKRPVWRRRFRKRCEHNSFEYARASVLLCNCNGKLAFAVSLRAPLNAGLHKWHHAEAMWATTLSIDWQMLARLRLMKELFAQWWATRWHRTFDQLLRLTPRLTAAMRARCAPLEPCWSSFLRRRTKKVVSAGLATRVKTLLKQFCNMPMQVCRKPSNFEPELPWPRLCKPGSSKDSAAFAARTSASLCDQALAASCT